LLAAATLLAAYLAAPALATEVPTAAPILYTPAASSSSSAELRVHYYLPEAAVTGTLHLVFEGEQTFQITLVPADATMGAHEFTIDAETPTSSSAVLSESPTGPIPDGTYKVKLSYEATGATESASVTNEHFKIITKTAPPTIISPSPGEKLAAGADLELVYSLPEAAAAGTVGLVFIPAEGSLSYVSLPGTTAGTHSVTVDLADLAELPPGGLLVIGPSELASGEYTLDLQYEDALQNPVAGVTVPLTIERASSPASSHEESASKGSSGAAGGAPGAAAGGSATSGTAHPPARLPVVWRPTDRPRELTATFAPVTGARSYTVSVRSGHVSRSAGCHVGGSGRHRQVKCVVRVPSKGRWTATATATGAGGMLADATTGVRFHS
jgi:hypothetical protein